MMIRAIIITIFLCLKVSICLPQKPILDFEAVKKWEEASIAELSPDGRFGYYQVFSSLGSKTILKNTANTWEVSLPNLKRQIITNKYFIFQTSTDSVCFFDLTKRKRTMSYCGGQLEKIGDGDRIQFLSNTIEGQYRIVNAWSFETGLLRTFNNVVEYASNSNSSTISLVRPEGTQGFSIDLVDLVSGKMEKIWEGKERPLRLIYNATTKSVAFFLTKSDSSNSVKKIIVARLGKPVQEISVNVIVNYTVEIGYMKFGGDNHTLVFPVLKNVQNQKRPTGVALNIWNYKDNALPIETDREQKWIVFDQETGVIYNYAKADDETIDFEDLGKIAKYIIVYKGSQKPDELQLDRYNDPKRSIIIKGTKDSSEKIIAKPGYYSSVVFSPNEKFVVYFDRLNRQYCSFELSSGKTVSLTRLLPRPELVVDPEREFHKISQAVGLNGWIEDNNSVLIRDQFDIWAVDLRGEKPAVCVTGQYGFKNRVRLFIFQLDNVVGRDVYHWNDEVWIKGVNADNYMEAFTKLRITLNGSKDVQLKLVPASYGKVKRYKFKFLVSKSGANDQLNWSISSDLKVFFEFSNLQPQRAYNWFTRELVSYQLSDATWNKGILYKPEDFNPKNKYPVIIQMYEILSDKIYTPLIPRLMIGPINPAWMCSRGYIVFQPDIKFNFGNPGECAFNSVMSGADFLSKFSWVDSTRIGLSGGSHGAFSINYIVTKTNRFAAAVPTDGMVDEISGYNYIRFGLSRQFQAETDQERMGATLWERPDVYIKNSPIFYADKVETPILIMHNRGDGQVPWAQGLEWYLGLRRNGKKVWMLEYEGEGHGVHQLKNQVDFTKRVEQFFGHFLKGNNCPFWMTSGLKSLDVKKEFDLDTISVP